MSYWTTLDWLGRAVSSGISDCQAVLTMLLTLHAWQSWMLNRLHWRTWFAQRFTRVRVDLHRRLSHPRQPFICPTPRAMERAASSWAIEPSRAAARGGFMPRGNLPTVNLFFDRVSLVTCLRADCTAASRNWDFSCLTMMLSMGILSR